MISVDDTNNIFRDIDPPIYPPSPTGELPFSVTDQGCDVSDFFRPVGYWDTLDDEEMNEENRAFTLWLHGYSCYMIDKYEAGEDITLPCADLTPPELLHLGKSIKKVLDEYGVDL